MKLRFNSNLAGYVVLFASLGAVAAGCGDKNAANTAAAAGGPMPVQTQVVETKQIPVASEFLSVLKSRHSSAINPQVEGQIVKIFVKSGDHVKLGEPLLQIDPLKQEATVSSQEAARAAQEANKRFAQISLERAKKLFDAGVISKQDYDNAQTTYDAADAQLRALDEQVRTQKVQLHYYQVSAPMDGIVGDIPVRVGDSVSFSTLLTTVDEPGALEAYIYVPVNRSKDLKLGLPVRLVDENQKTVAETSVTFISPQVDTDTQTILAKALVANSTAKLRIAQQVRAQVTWSSSTGPVVPVLSVVRINGEFFAFVASKEQGGTFARQKVLKVGEPLGNDYPVLSGVQSGDHLITSGTQFLQDGMPVAEQTPAPASNKMPTT
ncbi:MAG: efflux RND transporter periplasmic adaptor subunit [Acidobacteria bacterium]|nr:efflux RND transporter periplasmic adaptor subunit [Acidobacteriota bacterium]MBS1867843.1 efflux RND transporter periplasmic adaptor subunit [Acidobacteriota bacterium]